MSQGGTTKNQETAYKRALLDRVKLLDPKPGQVILVELPRQTFSDVEQMQLAQAFAEEIGKAAKRNVFLVPDGTVHVADDPRPQQPTVPVAKQRILLPSGVKLDG